MVRSPQVHRQVIEKVWEAARTVGLAVHGLTPSPLLGPAGNREFFLWLRPAAGSACPPPDEALIRAAVQPPAEGGGRLRPEL